MSSTIVVVYENSEDAMAAVEALSHEGVSEGDVSFLNADEDVEIDLKVKKKLKLSEGVKAGGLVGGFLFAAFAFLALVVSADNELLSVGPLATVLIALAIGVFFGILCGGLFGAEVSEDEAKSIHLPVQSKEIVLGLTVDDDRRDPLMRLLQSTHAKSMRVN